MTDIDILEMMKKTVNLDFGTYDVRDDSVRIGCGHLRQAIAEITKLRAQVADLTRIAGCVAVAGAVDVPVKTFEDIKRDIKRQNRAMGVADGEIDHA